MIHPNGSEVTTPGSIGNEKRFKIPTRVLVSSSKSIVTVLLLKKVS